MSRETDRAEALRTEFVRALVDETGMREVMALPIADSLLAYFQREYPGEKLYIPYPTRAHPVDRIEADLRAGIDASKVCKAYRISRRTLSRLFPGGVPKADSISSVA